LQRAIQVADLVADPVADPVSDKFVRLYDQLATSSRLVLGRKQVADRFELPEHVEIARTRSQTCSKTAFDLLSTGLRHADRGLCPGRRPG